MIRQLVKEYLELIEILDMELEELEEFLYINRRADHTWLNFYIIRQDSMIKEKREIREAIKRLIIN